MTEPKKKVTRRKKGPRSKSISIPASKSLREVMAEANKDSPDFAWELRPFQQEAYDAFNAGKRRQGLFWHRRAGKDIFSMNLARVQMKQRIGGYVHFFPKHIQAKRAIWNGIDPRKGARFIDIAFGDMEAERNNTELMIEAFNGSTWQLLGSDNYDRVVGSNIVGVVFSEWALCDPRAWDYIRPIILENNGYAIFITTFRGRNHAWQMSRKLRDNPNWYIDLRTVEDTTEIDGSRIITDELIQEERESGMSEAMIQQEYYCNPEAVSDGAIYGIQVEEMRADSRRQQGSWNPNKPVHCVWNFDLPLSASCIFVQPGQVPILLGGETYQNISLSEAIANAEKKRYPIHSHILSGDQSELLTFFHDLDRRPNVVYNALQMSSTVETATILQHCYFDYEQCEELIDSLSGYVRRETFSAQSASLQFSDTPLKSWHSRLVNPLETWAVYNKLTNGDDWVKEPDYSAMDKIAKGNINYGY